MPSCTEFFLATDDALRHAFAGWREPTGAALDEAAAPDLSGFEVVEMKSVGERRLAQLLVARGEPYETAQVECFARCLVASSGAGATLEVIRIPDRLVDALASSGDEAGGALAAKWEAVILEDLASIPNESVRAFETERWTGACVRILSALEALVRKRMHGQSLYLLVTGSLGGSAY